MKMLKSKETLYRRIKLPSNEPVSVVGVHPLKWGKTDQPKYAFIEIEADEIENYLIYEDVTDFTKHNGPVESEDKYD